MIWGASPQIQWSADVRFGAHSGLKSGIAVLPKSANSRQVPIQMIVYFVTRCLVGATVLSGGVGEIASVNHVFQPDGRFAASNSP